MPLGNALVGGPPLPDDYSRNFEQTDADIHSGGPSIKRQRVDSASNGQWISAPTSQRGTNFPAAPSQWRPPSNNSQASSSVKPDEILDDTLNAAQQGVSPFFQTATDEELRGLNQTLRRYKK